MKSKTLIFKLVSLALMSCSDVSGEVDMPVPTSPTDENTSGQVIPSYRSLINKTIPYPTSYEQEAGQRGQVVEITYDTRSYVENTNDNRTNNAFVYLPYGYETDANRRCNILYLVHGHYGNASTFLTTDEGLLRKVLDNMIEQGDIEPLIVVTSTYNYGQPTPNYVDADRYCRALPQEMLHDLIPLVESRYRTYASTPDSVGLAASRNHRAIGGFSMGGVTTWYAFDQTLSIFRYFLPMSSDCWSLGAFAGMNRSTATAQHLARRMQQQGFGRHDAYIWAASGTDDSAYRETLNQIEGMIAEETFDLENLTFHEKDGARHEYHPMVEYIYNALPFFFPKSSNI